MVIAINEAITSGRLVLDRDVEIKDETFSFNFQPKVGEKIPFLVSIRTDLDEVDIHVAVFPTQEAINKIKLTFLNSSGGLMGRAHVEGWFARPRKGRHWLEAPRKPMSGCYMSKDVVGLLANLEVKPLGFDDHGPFVI
jgi:hypothetical protein